MMYCGTDVSREVVSQEPGPGTGEAIYTTSSGYRFCYWYGQLPRGFYWRQTASSNTATYDNYARPKSKEEEEIEQFLEDLRKGLKKRGYQWWMKYQAEPQYQPRFRRVRHLVNPEHKARSNPIHVRNRPWDPRKRA